MYTRMKAIRRSNEGGRVREKEKEKGREGKRARVRDEEKEEERIPYWLVLRGCCGCCACREFGPSPRYADDDVIGVWQHCLRSERATMNMARTLDIDKARRWAVSLSDGTLYENWLLVPDFAKVMRNQVFDSVLLDVWSIVGGWGFMAVGRCFVSYSWWPTLTGT